MVHAVVLLDIVPGKEDQVFTALQKVEHVVAQRRMNEKVVNGDVLVLLEADDMEHAERIAVNDLRTISGVYAVRQVQPEHTIAPQLGKLVMDMRKEATGG